MTAKLKTIPAVDTACDFEFHKNGTAVTLENLLKGKKFEYKSIRMCIIIDLRFAS